MNRTRWLVFGIVLLRVLVFLAAVVVARRLALGRTVIQAEAAMLTAIFVWLLMLQFLPRLREQGFAAFDASLGFWRVTLAALAMLGITLGVAVVAYVGSDRIFGGTLAVALILALEFSIAVVLSSLGYLLRRAIESSATRRPLLDLILGAQVLTALVTVTILIATRFAAAPNVMRLVAIAPVIVLGFLALGIIAQLALSAIKGTDPQAAL